VVDSKVSPESPPVVNRTSWNSRQSWSQVSRRISRINWQLLRLSKSSGVGDQIRRVFFNHERLLSSAGPVRRKICGTQFDNRNRPARNARRYDRGDVAAPVAMLRPKIVNLIPEAW
jgi:hypothetical protein